MRMLAAMLRAAYQLVPSAGVCSAATLRTQTATLRTQTATLRTPGHNPAHPGRNPAHPGCNPLYLRPPTLRTPGRIP